MPEDFYKIYKDLNLMHFIIFYTFHYLIIIAFFFLFYKIAVVVLNRQYEINKSILGIRKLKNITLFII
jgi:hypothetical protein